MLSSNHPPQAPLRLLIGSHSHPQISHGGAEIAAFQLFAGLLSHSATEPWFLGCQRDEETRRAGLTISQPFSDREFMYSMGEFEWFNFANRDPGFAREFPELLRSLKPDIVHLHHYANLGVESFLHVKSAIPDAALILTLHEYLAICNHSGQMIVTEDGSLCSQSSPVRCNKCFPQFSPSDFFLRKLYIGRFFGLVDHFISPSQFLADRYIAWGVPAGKLSIIENIGRAPASSRADASHRKPGPLRAAFFGQISTFKGLDVLLRTAEMLHAGGSTDIVFEIFGDFRNQGPENKEKFLKGLASAGSNVRYRGPYENDRVDDLMQSIDVVVVPSLWWENSPVVIQEALRNRRPVLCSDIGGMAEKVRDGLDGFHFPVGSAAGLAELLRGLAAERERLEQIDRTLVSPASAESILNRHLQLYTTLCKRA